MNRTELRKGLEQFGKLLAFLGANEAYPGPISGVTEVEYVDFQSAIAKEQQHNPWFIPAHVRSALTGISRLLQSEALEQIFETYGESVHPKRVAIIMAGNVPFVGFHDVLSVLVTGNTALCKFSSSDSRIPPLLLMQLKAFLPELENRLVFCFGPLKDFDAVIATGSNNTIASLKDYFKHVPALFRKNRTSIAVLDGSETEEELRGLADDCFLFFGMGCRNVGRLFVPQGFDLNRIFEAFLPIGDIINHHKYANNYDYQRTIFLMNQIPFLDNNAFMLKEDDALHAPLSVLHYTYYGDRSEVDAFISAHEEEIQIEVGHRSIPFGKAQSPGVFDFADNVDTFDWLLQL